MKKMMMLFLMMVAVGLFFAACEEEETTLDWWTDTGTDPDVTPDTPADVPVDRPPDITTDTPIETPPDIVTDTPDVPVEILPDTPGDAYGVINVNFTSPFIFDGDQLSNTTYMQGHPEGMMSTPAFTGTYGTGKTVPSSTAVLTVALAAHIPAEGTYPAAVAVMQQSAADTAGTTPANPWVELDFASDVISPGTFNLDIVTGSQATLVLLNSLGTTYCVLALAVGGSVNVSAASNTTATDGGSITLSGSSIPVYHPTNVPGYGDISGSLGVDVCPIE